MDRNLYTLADVELENRIQLKDHILLTLDKIIDWGSLEQVLQPVSAKYDNHNGRDSYGAATMLRIFIVQRCYDLSDRGIEEQLQYNLLFIKFCKFSISSPVPDHSTICRWRGYFSEFDVYERLFFSINAQLEKMGLQILAAQI